VLVIPPALVLMPTLGLAGVGVALLVGQSAVAAAILIRYWISRRA
jgi:hypothetical protein